MISLKYTFNYLNLYHKKHYNNFLKIICTQNISIDMGFDQNVMKKKTKITKSK